jgi:cytochrome b561
VASATLLPAAGRAMRPARYTDVAIVLHWLIAICILLQIAMGLAMVNLTLPLAQKFYLFQLHKSVGITVLGLVLLRIVWRLAHSPPPLPDAMPEWERRAAGGTHHTLYAFMLLLPLTGWAVVSASPRNIPTVLYGIVPWPHLPILSTLTDKKPVEAVLQVIHSYGGFLLIAILVLHIGAALRHGLLLRDGVLSRMLPWGERSA